MAAQLPIIFYNNKTLIMYTMECLVEKVFKGENKVILTKKNYLKVCKEMGWGYIISSRSSSQIYLYPIGSYGLSKKILLSKLEIRRAERIRSNIIKNK